MAYRTACISRTAFITALLALSGSALAEEVSVEPGFYLIEGPEDYSLRFNAMDDSGAILFGTAYSGEDNVAFMLTTDDEFTLLPELDDTNGYQDSFTFGWGVSGNGQWGVGMSYDRAVRWNLATGEVEALTDNSDYLESTGFAANYDGSVVVGGVYQGGEINRGTAFRWTESDGELVLLENTIAPVGNSSLAYDVSDDGTVVVGLVGSTGGEARKYAFQWTTTEGMTKLGDLTAEEEMRSSIAMAVSGDGTRIVGWSRNDDNKRRTVLWTEGGTELHNYGLRFGGDNWANDISRDGNVIVGGATTNEGDHHAFRIDIAQGNGARTIYEWLEQSGVVIGEDAPELEEAIATNEDGSVVIGETVDQGAFYATTEGLITFEDFMGSLYTFNDAAIGGAMHTSLLMHGAHSQPLMHYVPEGKFTAWIAGDYGKDSHRGRDGSIGILEATGGYNFGQAQLSVSVGRSWADEEMPLDGKADAAGTYGFVDLTVKPVAQSSVYLTVGGFAQTGDVELKRGYFNAGMVEYSTANPDVTAWGVRGRIDWHNALNTDKAVLSPYIDISYSSITVDGYTEQGGSFPAIVGERDEDITEARLGALLWIPLNESFRLIVNAEGVYRFDDAGPDLTFVTTNNLFGAVLGGRPYKQVWSKGGLGLDVSFNQNTRLVVMGNATTEGEQASYWGNTSLQVTF